MAIHPTPAPRPSVTSSKTIQADKKAAADAPRQPAAAAEKKQKEGAVTKQAAAAAEKEQKGEAAAAQKKKDEWHQSNACVDSHGIDGYMFSHSGGFMFGSKHAGVAKSDQLCADACTQVRQLQSKT